MRSKRICLGCKEDKPERGRGLCDACYESARRKVAAKKETWRKLINRGLALPVKETAFDRALKQSVPRAPKRRIATK